MEDILASIRRILSEDEAPAAGTAPPAKEPPARPAGDVLVLDPAMMVSDPAHEAGPLPAAVEKPPPPPAAPPPETLVAPAAAAAAASSVTSLMRTLSERSTRVYAGGPTVEEIVREELRPLLKTWLDENLPPLVERLVRAEIERVVGRAVP